MNTFIQINENQKPTQREMEVLKLLLLGLNNKQIAKTLFITTHTIKVHVASLLLKLKVSNRLQLAVVALKRDIIDLTEEEILKICSRKVYRNFKSL